MERSSRQLSLVNSDRKKLWVIKGDDKRCDNCENVSGFYCFQTGAFVCPACYLEHQCFYINDNKFHAPITVEVGR